MSIMLSTTHFGPESWSQYCVACVLTKLTGTAGLFARIYSTALSPIPNASWLNRAFANQLLTGCVFSGRGRRDRREEAFLYLTQLAVKSHLEQGRRIRGQESPLVRLH